MPIGLFVTGTDTNVGKTFVAAQIVTAIRRTGSRVGVYKPVASGCSVKEGEIISDDAVKLWEAAGKPRTLHDVCPFRFRQPLAPHLAARAEGVELEFDAMIAGIKVWADSDFIVVEGAGGLMSPVGDKYVADLAEAFDFPLVVVASNRIGTINQTLQTLIVASIFNEGLPIAGVVLNANSLQSEPSINSNFDELSQRCVPPILANVGFDDLESIGRVDWNSAAGQKRDRF